MLTNIERSIIEYLEYISNLPKGTILSEQLKIEAKEICLILESNKEDETEFKQSGAW